MKLFYAFTFSAIILLTGCSKSSDTPSSTSARGILTSGKWQITGGNVSFSYPGIPTQTSDIDKYMSSCELDNYIIFKTDGIAATDEGATKCDPSDPQVQDNTGHWELQSNNTKLVLTDPASGLTITCDVLQLDNNTMKLQFNVTNQGATSSTTYIFTHIK